jgi:undecaprenyl-diphosphatase
MSLFSHRNPNVQGLTGRNPQRTIWQPLLVAAFLAFTIFAFLKLGAEVVEGDTLAFDQRLLQLAQSLRINHAWIGPVMRDLSGLGSTIVLTLVTVGTVFYLALFSSQRLAALVAVSVSSGTLLVGWFKAGFGRIRPDLSYAEISVPGLSFPSGHATMSAIVFLTIGALISATRRRASERVYILLAAGLMTFLVGLSRVALGVHWVTDVMGGWAFGSAWAVFWLWLVSRMSRR